MQNTGGQLYSGMAAVTPSDTVEINCRAVYVGGAGNVALKQKSGGASVVFTAPPVGTIIPVSLDQGQIMSTGTTATLLVALS